MGALLGTIVFSGTIPSSGVKMAIGDYDGDGTDDLAIWVNDSPYKFYIKKSSGDGSTEITEYGTLNDIPVPGDYDGDGKTDLAVFRSGASAAWYWIRSSDSVGDGMAWGNTTSPYLDVPVQGKWLGNDYDDVAVWRDSDGNNWIAPSTTIAYGTSGDLSCSADYDGDGLMEASVFRPSNKYWYITGGDANLWSGYTSGDVPITVDFDGDGKADMSFWRESNKTLYVKPSLVTSYATTIEIVLSDFTTGDLICTGKFRGDGRDYIAYYRPSNKTLYYFSASPRTTIRNYRSKLSI